MTQPALSATSVSKRFGDFVALEDLHLEVNPGEVVGFIGPNGAGKSTFLRTAVGLLKASGGELSVLGHDPARDPLSIRKRTSYLPGETNVYASMTGKQFLSFNREFYKSQRPMPESLREQFEVPLDRSVRRYSAGMKQKVALRATLEADVDLYLLDEPDRALDANARLALRDWIQLLRDEGRAVLLSSHHLAEVEALADRSVFLLDGRNVSDERIRSARETLKKRIRMQLSREIDLPSGTTRSSVLPDGTIEVFVANDPASWLSTLPEGVLESAEIGATRLDDIYRVLTEHSSEVNA
ncbi:MAG: ABC transporter ATP-binding protein [Planctomycetota bacterium]